MTLRTLVEPWKLCDVEEAMKRMHCMGELQEHDANLGFHFQGKGAIRPRARVTNVSINNRATTEDIRSS